MTKAPRATTFQGALEEGDRVAAQALPVVDQGLGYTSWLVDLGDGRGLVVDASRDLRAVRWWSTCVRSRRGKVGRRRRDAASSFGLWLLAAALLGVAAVAVLTAVSGAVVAVRMRETRPPTPPAKQLLDVP